MDADDQRRLAAISAAASRLRVDYAAVKAINALIEAGIPCLVLKGPSIARWLFDPEDARSYVDCDLLVAPGDFGAAVETLAGAGFLPDLDEAAMPSWWREHALTAFRAHDGAMIDLHRSVPGAEADDEHVWSTLSAATVEIPIGRLSVPTLGHPGRLMHAALHAAQHGGTGRDLEVLERGILRAGVDVWRAAARLASDVDAVPAFTQGLAMLPAGSRLVGELGLDTARTIEVELRAGGAVEALTFARLHKTRGLHARTALIWHKLFPPATFMRKWSPLARHSRTGLLVAYLYRPIWVARRAPGALSAWHRAHQTLKRHGETDSSEKE